MLRISLFRFLAIALCLLPPTVFGQLADSEFCENLAEFESLSPDDYAELSEWAEEYTAALLEAIESGGSEALDEFPSNWFENQIRVQIASCYVSGIGAPKDVDKAMALLEAPAADNYPNAVHILASLRLFNTDDSDLQNKGFDALEQEYKDGSAYSAGKLGWAYQKGLGVEPNLDKALELYEYAAESGMTYWQYLLAHAFEKGYLGLDIDKDRSDYWLKFKPKVHIAQYECWVAIYYADGTFPENEALRAKYQKICDETDIADVWEW